MKIFKNVRSTAEYVPSIEVNVDKYGAIDTVYVRNNIRRIEEIEFSCWEYDEIQYSGKTFTKFILERSELLEMGLLEMTTNQAIKDMELDRALMELTMMIGGM